MFRPTASTESPREILVDARAIVAMIFDMVGVEVVLQQVVVYIAIVAIIVASRTLS